MRFKLVLDTPLYGLYTASAEMYLKRGYYLKALELLKVVGDLNLDTIQVGDTVDSHRKVAAESSEKIIPDELKPAEQPSEVFDWSTPEPKKPAEDDFWGSYKSTAAEATLDPEPQQAADDDFWGSYKSTVAETTLDDEVLAEYDLKEPTIETEDPSISPIRESENQQGVIKCSIQDATRLATDNKVRERLRALLLWRIFTVSWNTHLKGSNDLT